MKERRQEITIHKDMLQAQYKAADEERQQISAELHERISKIDKLRKRQVTKNQFIERMLKFVKIYKSVMATLFGMMTTIIVLSHGYVFIWGY